MRLSMAVCFALCVVTLQAQTTAGIRGTVTDATNASISGARVEAHNVQTGFVAKATSTADGSYTFTLLPIGEYQVTVEASGFKVAEFPNIVLTNQQSGAAFSAVANQIKDSYFGISGNDWVKMFSDRVAAGKGNAGKVTAEVWKQVDARLHDGQKTDYSQYAGTYHDSWLGDITLTQKDGKLLFQAKRSPKLGGEILPYKANTFIVKWTIRSMDADSFIIFSLDQDGKPDGFKMKPISPATDFSYDFQDLDLHRVK